MGRRHRFALFVLAVGVLEAITIPVVASGGSPNLSSALSGSVVAAGAAALWLTRMSWPTATALTWLWLSAAVAYLLFTGEPRPSLILVPAALWFGALWAARLLIPAGVVSHFVQGAGTSSRRG
ncbi:hypothetical protein GCM10025789_09070 [Tessaracoccus lubricantis]|uniref:DUF3054 domain-containing protein n=1 Tax=Tessaracoccus lubricantis TaxID=545543 RepID=A0ABP9FBK5_9ACTN